ncbi:MAG: PTS sugar transporter subunit IIB, partial [Clostridium sp.]
MEIRSIMCCCGQGLGSSMIVSMNVEKALKKLGVSGVRVEHTALGEITENSADLFVVGAE